MKKGQITSKMLHIVPPKYASRCILHWEEKGWLIEIWIEKSMGMPRRYIITKERIIFGIFTALLAIQNEEILSQEYFSVTEEEIIKIALSLTKNKIIKYEKRSFSDITPY